MTSPQPPSAAPDSTAGTTAPAFRGTPVVPGVAYGPVLVARTVIDPDAEWVVDVNAFKSKSRNSPFGGWTVRGRAHTVIVGGRIQPLTN